MTNKIIQKIKNEKLGIKTIIIGSSKKALEIFNQMTNNPTSTGNEFIGIIQSSRNSNNLFLDKLKTI